MSRAVIPHFNAFVAPTRAAASLAYKDLVWTPMPDRPHLYYVYVGPFDTAADAAAAKSSFEQELKSYPQDLRPPRFRSFFHDVLSFRESPTIHEYWRRARGAAGAAGA
jgi:hypothetical protein